MANTQSAAKTIVSAFTPEAGSIETPGGRKTRRLGGHLARGNDSVEEGRPPLVRLIAESLRCISGAARLKRNRLAGKARKSWPCRHRRKRQEAAPPSCRVSAASEHSRQCRHASVNHENKRPRRPLILGIRIFGSLGARE